MDHIDSTAPLVARAEADIAAPIASVWEVLTDVDAWPEWQPDVSAAAIDGPLVPGTTFRWKAKGVWIDSRLELVDAPRRIVWSGRSLGLRAIHAWILEPKGDTTRVVTEESMHGWLAHVLRAVDRQFLDKSLASALEVLRTDVETP